MFSDPSEAISYIEKNNIRFIDVRFSDLFGVMQHFNIPAEMFADALENGLMFDGSSVRGFTAIHESDMKLKPDVKVAFVDPFRVEPTLAVNFSIVDPFTDEPFSRDPRSVAAKAEDYMRSTGIADTCYVGAEPEFYLFDSIRYQSRPESCFYEITSSEGSWATGDKEDGFNQGYKMTQKGGYFPVSPNDQNADLRDTMVAYLQDAGLVIERAHHEVGSGGQQEISYQFASLLHAADNLMKFKYIVRNVAWEAGKTATFMPKPLFGENGSGMHCHLSLWKDEKPLFFDERGYGGLSDIARWFVGGLLHHAPAMLAFTNPSINSYRRLVPGFEAPVNLVYSARNRSACIRVPITGTSPKAKRIEYRVPDPSANPYLAFSACLMAGLDGIANRIEPAAPVDKDLYELKPEEFSDIAKLPPSLDLALKALEDDHDFLTKGNVFTEDLLETWVSYKRDKELSRNWIHPHPFEFELYYNC